MSWVRAVCRAGIATALLLALPACAAAVDDNLSRLRLPPGFHIEVYGRVPGARSMAVAEDLGAVFVGTRGSDVYAVTGSDGEARLGRTVKVLSGLKVANGIAWKDGWLYIAERHRVVRYRTPSLRAVGSAGREVLFEGLPDKGHHGWRYAAAGPDGRLYVAVGAPCNICVGEGFEGSIVRLPLTGGQAEIFARGVRNSVGLDFHPRTGELYFTDNGADRMGNDSPPDELNHAPRPGLHFGFPYFGGGGDRTSRFRDQAPPMPATPPVVAFGAHVAALGIHFYRGAMLPAEYRTDAFVAQHGSWNRSPPDGYRVVRVRFDAAGHATGYETFIEGWLNDNGSKWGRPVDVKSLPDGSLLVSDDEAGVIYRVTYSR